MSLARQLANIANAKKSTGPRTPDGKAHVRLNALKHGLTGQDVVLTEREHPVYAKLGAQFMAELKPVGVREEQLAQKIIDANWQLNKCAALEMNLFAIMVTENVDPLSDDVRLDTALAQARGYRADCAGPMSLDKLSRYRQRISRDLFKFTEELERLQVLRKKEVRNRECGIRTLSEHDGFVLEESDAHTWYRGVQQSLEPPRTQNSPERNAPTRPASPSQPPATPGPVRNPGQPGDNPFELRVETGPARG